MNRKITFFLILVIILAAVVMNLPAYPKLPEQMASHWEPSGQADGKEIERLGIINLKVIL